MGEHTKTPWKIGRGTSGLSVGLIGADSRHVASSSWHDSSHIYPTQATTIANFEFIVKAVNAHDALVATLHRIIDLDHHNMGPEGEATKIARAALHAVNGGERS